ncbi:hypothetical protein Q766_07870 [Flavobacterium subsaxonicum WB 4.1-42 = DSM 21790]|uniref:PNPLA domain-containing protein n=2 Tax=Flavobacterium TaxID=237 RepID=A0A0A2MYD4_9FLAO|nr:hypothetical protein Q766_07870 [Flavobacterium subsaxonicum WB 4.1-42 = DSM 21790]
MGIFLWYHYLYIYIAFSLLIISILIFFFNLKHLIRFKNNFMENQENTFHAGICMAGAVSAGAYTAGVMDYILESLEHWEKAKQLQREGKLTGVPKHNFIIDVLGGASAGGMTAAITAAAVQQDFEAVTQDNVADAAIASGNALYNSWVNLKEDAGRDMMDYMLSTDDILNDAFNKSKEVRAGFNSAFVKDLASAVLDKRVTERYTRPYISADLDIFTTITNLRGFAYKVIFDTSTGTREHRMKMHRDYAFFKLSDTKAEEPVTRDVDIKETTASTELPNDGRIPVNFATGENTDVLKQAAMSTGAFPVGLESRDLNRKSKYIQQNKYLNLILSGQNSDKIQYDFLPEGDDYLSLNVDGGVINNEPYEITQQLLDDRQKNTITDNAARLAYTPKTKASEFDSVVLMIDPFPNDEEAEATTFVPKKAWINVLPSILSAMRGQLMMKDDQVKRAYLSDDYTRFLIMPVREKEKYTIACGSLGGFGGFFSKDFRKHDYFLGRRNCQYFLKKHFTAPQSAGNPILKFGYEGVDKWGIVNGYLALLPDLRVVGDEVNGYSLTESKEEVLYPYPQIKLSYILGLRDKMEKRIKCVLDNVQNYEGRVVRNPNGPHPSGSAILTRIRKKSWWGRSVGYLKGKGTDAYLWLGKTLGKGPAAEMLIDAIIIDMEKRGLINDDHPKV